MDHEHEDDLAPEVDEGAEIETEVYGDVTTESDDDGAVVTESDDQVDPSDDDDPGGDDHRDSL
jgi:hypothetical protein